MPPNAPFKPAERGLWHPAEIQDLAIAILDVVGDAIGKNVVHGNPGYSKAGSLAKFSQFAASICVSDRATRLGFRIPRYEFGQSPKLPLALRQQNPYHFPGVTVVDHDFQRCPSPGILSQLLERDFWSWRVMNHAKRIDQIVWLDRYETTELLSIPGNEPHAVMHPIYDRACAGDLKRFLR